MRHIVKRQGDSCERSDRTVRTAINHARQTGSARLPTVADMASAAGVSPAAISAVLKAFRSAGILEMKHRAGIRLSPGAPAAGVVPLPASQPPRPAGPLWKRVCADFRHDIAAGMHSAGRPLPNVKELTARYGVGRRTMSRVLAKLCDESILQRQRRSYLPGILPHTGGRQTIVLAARGDNLGDLSMVTLRTRSHLRQLESLCSQSSLKLQAVPCWHARTAMQGTKAIGELLSRRDSIMGFFIWNVALEPAFVRTVVGAVSSARMPVALLDEEGGVPREAWVGRSRARVLRVAVDEESGWLVAQHLLRLGHRHIAFIDNGENEPYSSLRLQGLRRGFAESGFSDAVTPVTPLRIGAIPQSGENDQEQYRRIEAVLPGHQFARTGKYSVRDRIALDLVERVKSARQRQNLRRNLFPELLNVLQRSEITAWVGVTDIVALECLDFLMIEKTPVPGRISVIGFDDSDEAFVRKLTSFNFNSQAVIQAGFSYLVNPGSAIWKKHSNDAFTVKGYVAERATVGPAHQQLFTPPPSPSSAPRSRPAPAPTP